MNRKKQVFADCMKKNKLCIILFLLFTALNGTVFALYRIMAEPFIYAEILAAVFLAAFLAADCGRELKAAKEREALMNNILISGDGAALADTLRDKDYSEMIKLLSCEIGKMATEFSSKQQADSDYYTAWIHQIKTPIAVMKLRLSEDTEENRALRAELFRIEQYVGMVLDYIRLESSSKDLAVKEYSVDAIIKDVLHKFAYQFIIKKLRLVYEPEDFSAVTDKAWLAFILEQLISNAIKYTPEGEVKIIAGDNKILVKDTGIGIAPEDLPRIFEKGYTGLNGRLGQKSSGLGLFLTRKAADLISAEVLCESKPGEGSAFTVILPVNGIGWTGHD